MEESLNVVSIKKQIIPGNILITPYAPEIHHSMVYTRIQFDTMWIYNGS